MIILKIGIYVERYYIPTEITQLLKKNTPGIVRDLLQKFMQHPGSALCKRTLRIHET